MDLNEYQNYHETKRHTPSDFPFNIYLCSIPLDFTNVPVHWHTEVEWIVVKKGMGTVSVDFEDFIVSAGDIILVLPGKLHAIKQYQDASMEYENILFHPSLLSSGTDPCSEGLLRSFLEGERPSDTFLNPSLSYYPQISEAIRNLDLLNGKRPDGYRLALKGWLYQLCFLLISNQKERDPASKTDTKSLERIKFTLKYVENHYMDPLSIEEMARVNYCSKSYFMKFFKSHMGVSFIEYLNHYRLLIAARLLITSSLSVLEICSAVGFHNLSYFMRLFKREFGRSPGAYRRS